MLKKVGKMVNVTTIESHFEKNYIRTTSLSLDQTRHEIFLQLPDEWKSYTSFFENMYFSPKHKCPIDLNSIDKRRGTEQVLEYYEIFVGYRGEAERAKWCCS